MALPPVCRIHIHLQHMELACQFSRQHVAGNAAAGRIHHPQLPALKAVLQCRQVQAVAGEHPIGFVVPEQFASALFNARQQAELVGVRNACLRPS